MSPILNYTTQIESAKTVSEIEKILVAHGAKNISKDYDDNQQIQSLSFIVIVNNREIPIQLPVDPDGVHRVMESQGVRSEKYLTRAHAVRVAWRIIKDWVAAQMALLEARQVKMEQVFLPYVVTPSGKTVYQVISESKFPNRHW